MLIKQLSVFVENTTGRLAELTNALAADGIDIKASCIADTVDFGILRCIVDDPEKATAILKSKGFTASITEVLAAEMADRPGGFAEVLDVLAKEQIGVDYVYSTVRSREGTAAVILKVENPETAAEQLKKNGVKVYTMKELLEL